MTARITEEEWLQELSRLSEQEDSTDGLLTSEIADKLGVGIEKARALVRRALDAGILERVRLARTGLDGITRHWVGFRPCANEM